MEEARKRLKEVKLENRELKHKLAKAEFVLFTTKERLNFELGTTKERIESLCSLYARGRDKVQELETIVHAQHLAG